MRLQVHGGVANFGQGMLSTNRDGLAILILQRQTGQQLALNSWLNFTYPNPVKLDAALVNGLAPIWRRENLPHPRLCELTINNPGVNA